ncbi:MAG: menaquinone biosynthesis decarboxylase [Opitutales bacterium]
MDKTLCNDLQEFIALLENKGELIRIKDEISLDLEISKITDAESKKPNGGKALLFEKVKESPFPVATNLFGSDLRMSLALNVSSLAQAGDEIDKLVKIKPPKSLGQMFSLAKDFFPLLKILPKKRVKKAPCQEVIAQGDDINLEEIPVLKCWSGDGGRFITLPLVFTKNIDETEHNLGMYRLQVFDKKTTGMHWHIHKDSAHFYNQYKAQKKRMPVAVAIGADPATIYSATAPLPRGIDELLLSAFFRKSPVKMVKCISQDLEVPANAEFVLEGYVEPDELRMEGPFGDHTGYYSLADYYPVFHLTAITRKAKPIYCATLVGPPPMEDCYMAKATERVFLPLLRAVFPEIKEMFLPWEGVFHNIVIISIKKEFPAHAQKLMNAVWGQGQMGFCKTVVVIDEDCDPSDLGLIWDKLLNNFDIDSDILHNYGILDVLDHSSPEAMRGNKLGIDLTNRLDCESPRKALNFDDSCDISSIKAEFPYIKNININKSFCGISLTKGELAGKDILKALIDTKVFDNIRAIAIFDDNIDVKDNSKMLWKVFNNVDPKRDIIFNNSKNIYIDACKKTKADGHLREWPDELNFD